MKIIKILLLLISISSYAQNNIITDVIVDVSYQGDIKYIDSILHQVNRYYKTYNIEIQLDTAWRASIQDNIGTTESLIDNFTNKKDLTIAFISGAKGKDYATSFLGQLYSPFSKIVIDINSVNYKRTVYILCHEIGHILGLVHSADKYNLMCITTHYDNLNVSQQNYLYNLNLK